MPSDQGRFGSRSPRVRALGLGLLVLVLLAGPLWVEALHLTNQRYVYERAEVTATGGTVEYGGDADVPHDVALSEDILCTEPLSVRACYLERSLLDNGAVPVDLYHSGPEDPDAVEHEYEYVRTRTAIYRPSTETNWSQAYVVEQGSVRAVENASEHDNPLYRVELTLTKVNASDALADVSVAMDRVGPVSREAVRTGSTTAYAPASIPQTPIVTEDGRYYRVYLEERDGPPETVGELVFLLRFVAPVLGLALGYRLVSRYAVLDAD